MFARAHKIIAGLALAALVAAAPNADAASRHHAALRHHHRHVRHHRRHHLLPVSPDAPAASLVFDAETGRILSVSNPDQLVYPASLTKMMTLYLTFRAVREGWLTLDDQFVVSPYAASAPPTKLRLREGTSVAVDDLIRGAVTESANDAARVLAEGLDLRFGRQLQQALRGDLSAMEIDHASDIADDPPTADEAADWATFERDSQSLLSSISADGSESDFARLMTLQARLLGMDNTVFRNASGLPDPEQVTTAPDFAMLAYAIVKLPPAYYSYFSLQQFDYRGVAHRNHNLEFLTHYDGADGIKTGYTERGGFNVVDSAVHGSRRLIAIVMGRTSHAAREAEVMGLLDDAFARDALTPVTLADPAASELRIGDALDLPTLPAVTSAPPVATAVSLPNADAARTMQ